MVVVVLLGLAACVLVVSLFFVYSGRAWAIPDAADDPVDTRPG